MVFKCQEDSYLKEFQSKVVLCENTSDPIVDYGKTKKFQGYGITLENTILFPAGGGQPHDVGWLNDVEVLQVVRKGETAVHFTQEPLEVGSVVHQRVDWPRRFDHMQQHSGQHLLSAVLEKEHNLCTSSWWLGAEECHVELGAERLAPDLLRAVEERCNQLIREARPVLVETYQKGDKQLDQAHSRGLPGDQHALRVVVIAGLDRNLCCGTHVASLAQLQALQLLGAAPGKHGRSALRFLVGARVLRRLHAALLREHALTALLKNEPKKHEELIQKLQNNYKAANKNLQAALAELARLEARRILAERPKFAVVYREGAGGDYSRAVCRELEAAGGVGEGDGEGEGEGGGTLVLAAAADGQLVLAGPARHVRALAPRIIEVLKGKGAFSNNKYQGRAGDLSALPRCRDLLQRYFDGQ